MAGKVCCFDYLTLNLSATPVRTDDDRLLDPDQPTSEGVYKFFETQEILTSWWNYKCSQQFRSSVCLNWLTDMI